MKFELKGTFRLGKRFQTFDMTVDAKNEKLSREKVYSILGGNHQCKRRFLKFEGVKVVK